MESNNVISCVNQIVKDQNLNIASVARSMNKSKQILYRQLSNDDIKLSTMFEILNAIHCDIEITITDRATGKVYKP